LWEALAVGAVPVLLGVHAPKEWLLTYVNQLLALPPGERDVGDLKAHVAQTLTVAKPWLRAADLLVLEGELEGLLRG
jgi:hypothetical protein